MEGDSGPHKNASIMGLEPGRFLDVAGPETQGRKKKASSVDPRDEAIPEEDSGKIKWDDG